MDCRKGTLAFCALLGTASTVGAQTQLIKVEVGSMRERRAVQTRVQRAVTSAHDRIARLTAQNRQQYWRGTTPLAMPFRVELTENGKTLPPPPRRKFADFTLNIDSTFPAEYRQMLQDTFAAAKPTMDAVFGPALLGGTVNVINADAGIGDRQAITGGFYLPNNGSGQREIQFPIFLSREAGMVNFLHCLLLAYQGTTPFQFDAFQEGLVRAATARIARTAGTLPSTDPEVIEQVLFNTYEVGGWYDWHNQRALGGKQFIAPNLIRESLPIGGTYGGLYLLRYRMSGSVWTKVLTEYPTFAAELNAALGADPSIAGDRAKLIAAGQAILTKLRPTSPTIEGVSFSDWVQRQYILETQDTNGVKALAQVTPIVSGLSGPDYGVFNIELHYFRRASNGDETLLSGVCYPVFWDTDFDNRISPSAQDDRMDIAGAYGSVGPNFTDTFGTPYRVNVELPVADLAPRLYLPVGSIARAGSVKSNNFYGTVTGVPMTLPGTYHVVVRFDSASPVLGEAQITRFAFGTAISGSEFERSRSLLLQVVRRNGADTQILMERRVNKGPGELAVDLRGTEFVSFGLPLGIVKGLQGLGLPLQPLASSPAEGLGLSATDLLLARYNPSAARYDLFPDTGAAEGGHAYLLRAEAPRIVTVTGRREVAHGTWALRPGWNMVSLPFDDTYSISNARVMSATSFPVFWSEAVGSIVGNTVFQLALGGNDPATGAPETGGFKGVSDLLQPGRLYFVRCLSPNGAVVNFNPSLAGLPGGGESGGQGKSGPGGLNSGPVWSMNLRLSGGAERAEMVIGTSRTATEKFDVKEDSTAPPKISPLAIFADTTDRLYLDVRRSGQTNRFRVRVEGLKKGQTYKLEMTPERGYTNWVTLIDPVAKRTFRPYRGATYSFTARGTGQTFDVMVVGA